MIYYCSDIHFFHSSIITFCKRPFTSVPEMNEALINNWNSKITNNNDTVYFLGDFALGSYTPSDLKNIFDRLNGQKVLIYGNHDHSEIKKLPWVSQHDILMVKDSGYKIMLCHYPMRSWNGSFHGTYHFFGHEHGRIPNIERAADVGVDSWNLFPTTFVEVKNRLDEEQLQRFSAAVNGK
jgi:calcineurin-like phosphoesterase family protein